MDDRWVSHFLNRALDLRLVIASALVLQHYAAHNTLGATGYRVWSLRLRLHSNGLGNVPRVAVKALHVVIAWPQRKVDAVV